MHSPLIRIENAICRLSSRQTLRVDHFSVSIGQHWCLFGGNGSGKSVLTALLLGQLPSGRSHVHHASDFSPRRDVAVVSFEEQQRLWARDNRLDMSEYSDSARDRGTTVAELIGGPAAIDDRGRQLLHQLGLDGLEDQGIRFLSSGQVRRALIARALYQNPSLLVMDEPLESVDRDSKARIEATIQKWQGPHNASLLLSRREAGILAGTTHLAILDELRVVCDGPLARVMSGPEFSALTRSDPLPEFRLPEAPTGDDVVTCSGAPGAPLIELRGVSAAWHGRPILQDVHWVMEAGHHTLIEGPNGCGKSTLLGLIDGDNHMAYGQEVYLFGRRRGSGESVWDVKSQFGVVSNELHNRYVKGWRVLDVVVSGFFDSVGLYDASGGNQVDLARQWLRVMGLESRASHAYHELSFGQQRLVLLARAMIKHPRILVLDEPCVGLDDRHRRWVLHIVELVARQTRTRILFVSHTHGDAPACINQHLYFEQDATGAYHLHSLEKPFEMTGDRPAGKLRSSV